MSSERGSEQLTLMLDGERVEVQRGETLYQIAERERKEIPTLCYDDRLEPFGGCRLCVVEVEGIGNPVARGDTPPHIVAQEWK